MSADWQFEFQANNGRFEVRVSGSSEKLLTPDGPVVSQGDEALENFRQFATGWVDGQNERVVGSFPWARVLHAVGKDLQSPSTGAIMNGHKAWKLHVFPAAALDAADWEVG